VEVIAHDAESDDLGKIEFAEFQNNFHQFILFHITEWKSIKRRSGHYMIYGFFFRYDHSCYSGHDGTSL
jgi:hypothetical protein